MTVILTNGPCYVCGKSDDDPTNYGASHEIEIGKNKVAVHYYCLVSVSPAAFEIQAQCMPL